MVPLATAPSQRRSFEKLRNSSGTICETGFCKFPVRSFRFCYQEIDDTVFAVSEGTPGGNFALASSSETFGFAVIGAGIAGALVAAELTCHASVLILEMERQPGYHTTGRSAAVFAPGYGPKPIRTLTRASTSFFENPPDGLSDIQLVKPLDVIMIAREDQVQALDGFLSEVSTERGISRIGADEIGRRHLLLKPGYAESGALDTSGSDIDVNILHHGFLAFCKHAGGKLVTGARAEKLSWVDGVWEIRTTAGSFKAATIVNTAGAWADELGKMAGAETIGLVAKRRTAMMIDAPLEIDTDSLPLIVDIGEKFYMKPDVGRLLISPANEDPMEPCDVQLEEMDIAICADRIEKAFNIEVRSISNKWAGLRSFVADRCPVVGYSDVVKNFFWLAGQGGYGIQTSPALSRYAAALALGNNIPADISNEGLSTQSLAPNRLRKAA